MKQGTELIQWLNETGAYFNLRYQDDIFILNGNEMYLGKLLAVQYDKTFVLRDETELQQKIEAESWEFEQAR